VSSILVTLALSIKYMDTKSMFNLIGFIVLASAYAAPYLIKDKTDAEKTKGVLLGIAFGIFSTNLLR
jgi:hypothetical protein